MPKIRAPSSGKTKPAGKRPANRGTRNFPTNPLTDKRISKVTKALLKGRH